MARKCARTFSIVVEKGKKSILDVGHLLPDALPRSVAACGACQAAAAGAGWLRRMHTLAARLVAAQRGAAMTMAPLSRLMC